MREITITANDAGRRLDRFLRKYLSNASLGEIYKLIRKDVKVDGRRRDESYMLSEGEVLTLYISDDVLAKMTGEDRSASAHGTGNGGAYSVRSGNTGSRKARKQFRIIYEDDNILAADKPFGLLTHGDSREKKHHLANQVTDYLIENGDYDPRAEKVFSPAPANRIDRNTTGLVLFGKNAAAMRALNQMIREDMIDKYYLTIVHGTLAEEMTLTGTLTKDESRNRVSVSSSSDDGREIITVVTPLEQLTYGKGYRATLVEVRLVTGRPHQIRAHLASIGHPVIGDAKYADNSVRHTDAGCMSAADIRSANEYLARRFHLTTQLLHAHRLVFRETVPELGYLEGRELVSPVPKNFGGILEAMRGR